MKEGRIILKAKLTNMSPIGIGSGRDDHSDRDVVTTLYPMDPNCRILTPNKINEATFMKEMPFIPATSFMGKAYGFFDNDNHHEIKKYWGESEENASYIDCSDILLTELPDYAPNTNCKLTEIRDGIRLDSTKGTVAQGAKFDYELLGPGAKFDITMVFRVEEGFANYDLASLIASSFAKIINDGFDLGAKSTVGYGRMKGRAQLYEINFENPMHFKQWIENDLFKNPKPRKATDLLKQKSQSFEINATFRIKNSLIIRSYSTNPEMPDSTHLKSGGKNIMSGSSIKGALRGRAERILNTIQFIPEVTEYILAGLFGDVEKEDIDRQKVKKDGYTIPSRILVDEVPIEPDTVSEEQQTRIQIDRFTGGTIDGALIEEVPLFPVKDKDQINNFCIRLIDPQPLDKGLLLLLLKDLWTSDLPIGGEKSIGRGVLEGIKATVKDNDKNYLLPDVFTKPEEIIMLQTYITALNSLENYSYYKNRVEKFKDKKK